MKLTAPNIADDSIKYKHRVSNQAQNAFFYPISIGMCHYLPGYYLQRDKHEDFQLIFVTRGTCHIRLNEHEYAAHENQAVLLDCYKPHTYYTRMDCFVQFLHFDGPMARTYFELIQKDENPVITLPDPYRLQKELKWLIDIYQANSPIREALISQSITIMLTELILARDSATTVPANISIIREVASYIEEHYDQNLTIAHLADRACLSEYHFSRLFKQDIGCPPHEYLLRTRLYAAKHLLRNSTIPLKDISSRCGFTSDSAFSAAFKKWFGTTPKQYRFGQG